VSVSIENRKEKTIANLSKNISNLSKFGHGYNKVCSFQRTIDLKLKVYVNLHIAILACLQHS